MANSSHKSAAKPGKDKGWLSNWRGWFLAILLVSAIIFAVVHWGDVKKFAHLVAHAEPLWLIAAVGAQLFTYVALAVEWLLVLRACECPTPFFKFLPLTVTKHFADQMVPTAGMSGNVVVVDRLVTIGAARRVAVAAVILTIIAYYAAYGISALGVLLLLWLKDRTTWLIVGLIVLFLAVAVAIPLLSLWLQKRGEKAIPQWFRKFGPVRELFEMIGDAPGKLIRNPRIITQLSFLNGLTFVLDGLTMQLCLFALGVKASFGAAFVAFIMASIVVTLSAIPMGLGSFEATSIAMLRLMGVPFEAALSATLLFRGFTLWLPLLPGLVTTRRHLKRKSEAKARNRRKGRSRSSSHSRKKAARSASR